MMEGFVKVLGSARGCEDVGRADNSTCSKHSKLDDPVTQINENTFLHDDLYITTISVF